MQRFFEEDQVYTDSSFERSLIQIRTCNTGYKNHVELLSNITLTPKILSLIGEIDEFKGERKLLLVV